jgi:hypothetical protein
MKHTNSNPSSQTIAQLMVDRNGNLHQRACKPNQNTTTQNTLFRLLYPNGHLACLSLLSELMFTRDGLLGQILSGSKYNGITYVPVGSRSSILQGELYLVDEETRDAIQSRFQHCTEALVSYLEILVRPSDLVIEQPDLRVLVVPQLMPGRQNWQGWIRESTSSRLSFPSNGLSRFVMAFGETQAEGELRVMADGCADRDQADIIIPNRSVKPATRAGGRFRGQVALGISELPSAQLLDGEVLVKLFSEHVCKESCSGSLLNLLCGMVQAWPRTAVMREAVLCTQI